tara:strand:+ start:302 stop:577 length:276 start_codon:yes stop_codon:yes gene_type:complete
MKHKTITSESYNRKFWLNDNQDFCCSPLDAQHKVDLVEDWIAHEHVESVSKYQLSNDLEHFFEIQRHLTIVQMGGFSTMLDSYRNRKVKTS